MGSASATKMLAAQPEGWHGTVRRGRDPAGSAHAPAPGAQAETLPAARFCAGTDFSRIPVTDLASGARMGQPGDRHEQEADRIADRITGSSTAGSRTAARAGDHHAARIAPSIVRKVSQWAGRPLESGMRRLMEDHVGGDFGAVRTHTGTAAARAAGALGARAFAVGRHIVFGDGQYNPAAAAGRRLLVHELAHTAQQRAGGAEIVQRDVVDDVKDKLSYGLFDWAVTDSEALESLALLGSIAAGDLAKAMQRLGSKYVTRMLDNLPDAAKTGDVYKRVVEAIGAAGAMPYAIDQLSYGVVDWAITDADVGRVFNIFTTLPADRQEIFLAGLDAAGRLGRLLGNANPGHYLLYVDPWLKTLTKGSLSEKQKAIVRKIVEKAPDRSMDTLVLATEARFAVSVVPTSIPGRTPVAWKPDRLRESYLALDKLPDAHVAHNKELLHFGQFSKDATTLTDGSTSIVAGTYSAGQQELAVNVKTTGDIAHTLIHETGHAVDQEMGWSTGAEPAKPTRGGWKSYGVSYNDCATDMVDDSAGAIKSDLSAPQRGDVVTEMATAMGNRSAQGLEARIKSQPWFGGLTAPTRSKVVGDPAIRAIGIGLNSPWFVATDGGEHLGPHVYQESYPSQWVSYRHEARARLLVPYQFRDSGEWFAECYAAYYTPDKRGKGAKLKDKDPDTKTYFDGFVDTRPASR
jgi:hypothetical protein